MPKHLLSGAVFVCLVAINPAILSHGGEVRSGIQSKKNPVLISVSVLNRARGDFEDNCTPCHGDEGRGDGPLAKDLKTKPRNLTSSSELSALSDGEIFWIITTGKDPMPAFGQKLTDEERWGLVHLLRKMSGTAANTTHRHAQ